MPSHLLIQHVLFKYILQILSLNFSVLCSQFVLIRLCALRCAADKPFFFCATTFIYAIKIKR